MPTRRNLPGVTQTNAANGLYRIIKWLIGDDSSYAGPKWKIIEAGTATSRKTPASGSEFTLSAFSTETSGVQRWYTGSLSSRDWIVLESSHADPSKRFQTFFEYRVSGGTYYWKIFLLPTGGFSTGAIWSSLPTSDAERDALDTLFSTSVITAADAYTKFGMPSNMVPEFYTTFNSTTVTPETTTQFTMQNSNTVKVWCVADEEMLFWFAYHSTVSQCRMNYVGQLDATRSDDDSPYVIRDNVSTFIQHGTGSPCWHRLSIDGTTKLTTGLDSHLWYGGSTAITNIASNDGAIAGENKWTVYPLPVFFTDSGNEHLAGFMRYVGEVHRDLAAISLAGSLNDGAIAYISSTTSTSGVAWFSGATTFP
jgi:hypothetical protein